MKAGYVVPTREKVAYGVGDLAINIAYGSISFHMLYFMVNIGGITPALAGIIFMVARMWDAVTDYFMGRISDNLKCKFGRRKTFIAFGAIPLGICFALLWFVPQAGAAARFVYYLIIYIIFNSAYTVVAVPYGALIAEMTQNYDERTSLSGYRVGFAFGGTLIGAAGIPLVTELLLGGFEKTSSYFFMGIMFGCVIAVLALINSFVCKERIKSPRTNYQGFFKTISSFFKLKEFRQYTGLFLFNMVGLDIIMAVIVFFIADTLKISGDTTLYLATPLVIAVVCAPLWTFISKKLGKCKSYIIALVYISLVMLSSLLLPANNTIALFIVCVLAGAGISACQILPYSILPDIIDIDEYKNGVRREGAISGIFTFMMKLASALAIAIVGWILGAFGYIEASPDASVVQNIVQPESALTAIRIVFAVMPVIAFIFSGIFTKKLNISKESLTKIIDHLEERRQQQ